MVIKFIISPQSPAWSPQGLCGIDTPAQFPIMIRRVSAVPIIRPMKIDFDETDFDPTGFGATNLDVKSDVDAKKFEFDATNFDFDAKNLICRSQIFSF